jgi:hypothetical protein
MSRKLVRRVRACYSADLALDSTWTLALGVTREASNAASEARSNYVPKDTTAQRGFALRSDTVAFY